MIGLLGNKGSCQSILAIHIKDLYGYDIVNINQLRINKFEFNHKIITLIKDDIRFQTDIDYIHKNNGIVIKIEQNDRLWNNPNINNSWILDKKIESIQNYNYIINDDSDIKDTIIQIDNIINKHF